ncbi:Uncharacterised protein [Cedecea davisae]|nr:Uncharacterised protein [Cedecea davisae]
MFIRLNLFGRGSRGRKSGPGLSYVLSGMFFFGLFFVSNAAFAQQLGLPGVVTFITAGEAGTSWCEGQGTNVEDSSGATDVGHACVPKGADPWLMNAGTGVSYFSSFSNLLIGLYAPVKDTYVARLWICDASGGPGECTMGQSVEHFDAATAVALDSSKTIEDQVPRWGGGSEKGAELLFQCLPYSDGLGWCSLEGRSWHCGQDMLGCQYVTRYASLVLHQLRYPAGRLSGHHRAKRYCDGAEQRLGK